MVGINVEVSFQRMKSHGGGGVLSIFCNSLYDKIPPRRGIFIL